MSMLSSLVSGTSFAQFADFASPAFFKVMPLRKLMAQGRELAGAYRDQNGFREAQLERGRALAAAGVAVTLTSDVAGSPLTAASAEVAKHGGNVLTLYFHQLLGAGPTLIDLAPRRFFVSDGRLLWLPGPGHVRWEPTFHSAIANIYTAYYGGGGEKDLRAALEPLGLAETTDLFIAHFGAGDQRAVTFAVTAFVESFHAIFVRCKARGIALHPNFLPLGLYLATLYATLEGLGGAFDVREAFRAAQLAR